MKNTHNYVKKFFPPKSSRLRDNVEECGRSRKATNNTITRSMRFVTLDN